MTPEQTAKLTAQVWRDLNGRLRQFVRSRIHSEADVDDVLQTVFLRIHQHQDQLRQADRLESWVFQITRNAIADHFRSRKISQENIDSIGDGGMPADVENVANPLIGCLRAFIEELPEDQRRAISLYEWKGLSQKEIALQEAVSLSGIKSRIQRGRKSLEAMLKACCEFQFDRQGAIIEFEANDTQCCDEECD